MLEFYHETHVTYKGFYIVAARDNIGISSSTETENWSRMDLHRLIFNNQEAHRAE